MKKILKFVLVLIVSVMIKDVVQAQKIAGAFRSETYFNVYDVERKNAVSQKMIYPHNKMTNQFYYTLDPVDPFYFDSNYDEYDNDLYDEELIKKIEVIAYYGYMYQDREDIKWYDVTQMLIWKTIYGDKNAKFTTGFNTIKDDKYDELLEELKKDVDNYYENTFLDVSYDVKLSDDLEIDIKDYIMIDESKLVRKDNRYYLDKNLIYNDEYLIYRGDKVSSKIMKCSSSRNLFLPINLPYEEKKISIKSMYDYFDIKVLGNEDGLNVYGLYDDKDELIKEIKHDDKVSLDYGKYYIKQISNDSNYYKDLKKYDINFIKEDSIELKVEKIIKNVTIDNKFINKNEVNREKNINFKIEGNGKTYLINTDNYGIANIKLGAGEYSVIQLNTLNQYSISDEFKFVIDENSDNLYFNIDNYKIKEDLAINLKTNIDGLNVCLYKNDQLIECISDINDLYIFNDLDIGKYQIRINDNKYDIDLNNDHSINIEYMVEDEDEIFIPNTDSSYNYSYMMCLGLVVCFLKRCLL